MKLVLLLECTYIIFYVEILYALHDSSHKVKGRRQKHTSEILPVRSDAVQLQVPIYHCDVRDLLAYNL
jgi:hypothetical protein